MAFYYRTDAITSFDVNFNLASAQWLETIEKTLTQTNELIDMDCFRGSAADNVKAYLNDAYVYINQCINSAIVQISNLVTLYLNAYIERVDEYEYAVIKEEELTDLSDGLKKCAEAMDDVDENTKRALATVYDIFSYSYGDTISEFTTYRMGNVIRDLERLTLGIKDLEREYSASSEMGKLEELIQGIEDSIKAAAAIENLSNYTPGSLLSSEAFQKMFNAHNELVDMNAARAEELEKAYETKTAVFEQLQKDYEERQKEAERVKWLTTIGTAVVGVVVTCATAGAGAPLVVALVTAGTSAVSAGVNSIYEQRIGTVACPGKVSAGKVITDAAIAGGTSLITSAIGAGFGQITKAIGGSSMNGVLKTGLTLGVETTESVVSGSVNRFINTSYKEGSIVEGFKDAIDGKKVLADAGSGFVGGAISKGSSAVIEKSPLKTEMTDTNLQRFGKSAVTGTGKSIVKGVGTRYVENYIKTGDAEIAWKESTRAENIIMDGATGGATEVVTGMKSLKYERYTLQRQKELDEQTERLNKGTVNGEKVEGTQRKKTPLEYAEGYGYEGVKEGKNGGVSFVECDEMIIKDKDGKGVSVNIETELYGCDTTQKKADTKTLYDSLVKSERFEEGSLEYKNNKIYYKGKPCSVHYQSDYNINKNTITVELLKEPPKNLHATSHSMKDEIYVDDLTGKTKETTPKLKERIRIFTNPTDGNISDMSNMMQEKNRKAMMKEYSGTFGKMVGTGKTVYNHYSQENIKENHPALYDLEQKQDAVLAEMNELYGSRDTAEEKIRYEELQQEWHELEAKKEEYKKTGANDYQEPENPYKFEYQAMQKIDIHA